MIKWHTYLVTLFRLGLPNSVSQKISFCAFTIARLWRFLMFMMIPFVQWVRWSECLNYRISCIYASLSSNYFRKSLAGTWNFILIMRIVLVSHLWLFVYYMRIYCITNLFCPLTDIYTCRIHFGGFKNFILEQLTKSLFLKCWPNLFHLRFHKSP